MNRYDARGLSCPEPVLIAKRASDRGEREYEVIVDNRVALENILRFAKHSGYRTIVAEDCNEYTISLFR